MEKKPRKGASRIARTVRSLAIIAAIGGVLAAYNIFTTRRDIGLATGPTGSAQQTFFADAAERPDLELFYKGLTPAQRLTMARHLGEYDDARMATVIGKLLGTFDPEARKALGESLAKLGRTQPDAVAAQFGLTGSFQQIAVSNALRSVGAPALPLVVKRLDEETTRANALAYLVEFGPDAVPVILPKLDSETADVRLAAADALGKLAARPAVPKLTELFGKSDGTEKLGYLSALASIGDPASETLLRTALLDESLTIPQRSQAALGLGRIGGKAAVATLIGFADHPDRQFRESARSALMLAGDVAITETSLPMATRIEVASGVRTPAADALLTKALADPALRVAAAEAAANRPALVPSLVAAAKKADDGESADRMMRALATTEEGRAALATLKDDPLLGGLAARRERIGAG
jgi:HEAT repeat protein